MSVDIRLDEAFKMKGSGSCCGKPQGCSNFSVQCRLTKHPLKRAMLGDRTVACPKRTIGHRCALLNLHDGPCDLVPE